MISSNGTMGDSSLIWKDIFQQFIKKEKYSNVKCVKKALVIRVTWKNTWHQFIKENKHSI